MIWMLFACQGLPEFVTISGTVFESSAAEEPVAGVSLEVFDVAMESVDSVDADGEGAFSAQARMGSYFFLSMSADGYVPTGVAGSVGPQDFAIRPKREPPAASGSPSLALCAAKLPITAFRTAIWMYHICRSSCRPTHWLMH